MLGSPVAISTPIGTVKITTTSSAARASKVIGGVIQSALNGNLTAFKCLSERRTIGVADERAVWAQGYNQVVTSKPELLAQYNNNINRIPPIDQSSPERAAASALANPYSASGVQTPAAVITADTPPLAGKGLPLWVLLLLAGGIGFAVYKATKK